MAVSRSTLTFTDEQISFASDLEPAIENLLRTLNVDEALITALKIHMINDRETFVGLDDTEAGFKNIAPELGIDLVNGGLAHKREMSRLISAWKQARVASEAKHEVDAVAKAHGVPTTLLPEDWMSMMLAFRTQFGKRIPDEKLLAQPYYEAFADKLAIGRRGATGEEQAYSSIRLSLDAKLTITTKKRLVSTAPVDDKSLRDKYAIMTNMWLLAQMKQPGRSIHRDLNGSTFMDFFERLLDKNNFNLHKEVNGTPLLVPKWTDCMSYECELRKEAYRLSREEGSGIKAALWTTIENTEHRIIHWLQLISIANSRPGEATLQHSSGKSMIRRKGGNRKSKALPVPSQQLALDKDRLKNRNQKKEKSKGSRSSSSKEFNRYNVGFFSIWCMRTPHILPIFIVH